jgi:hypothetical protein
MLKQIIFSRKIRMTRRECIIVHAILFVTFLDKLLKPIYLVMNIF